MLWDESADDLVLAGAAGLDIAGDIDVDGTANLDIVDIDGAVDMATTLAVAGNVDFNGDLDVDGTTNLDVVDIDGALTQDGGAVFNEDSADVDFRVESNNLTHALFINGANGNVGIGTDSPAYQLVVDNQAGDDAAYIQIKTDNDQSGQLFFGDGDHNYSGIIEYSHASNFMGFSTVATERMRIDTNGSVGIGTTAPNESGYGTDTKVLSIQGASTDNFGVLELLTPDVTSANRIGEITFGNLDGGGTVVCSSRIRGTRDGADNSSALSFWTTSAGTLGERMTINSSGLFRVPTFYTNPTYATHRAVYVESETGYECGYNASIRASKANIESISDVSWIYDVDPITFNRRVFDKENQEYTDESFPDKEYGIIAEDLEELAPELCFYDYELIDGEIDTENKVVAGIHYDRIVAPLIKVIQELEARITALESA